MFLMKFLKMIGILIFFAMVAVAVVNYPKLKLISSFTAKNMASRYFLTGRSVKAINVTDNYEFLTKLAKTIL